MPRVSIFQATIVSSPRKRVAPRRFDKGELDRGGVNHLCTRDELHELAVLDPNFKTPLKRRKVPERAPSPELMVRIPSPPHERIIRLPPPAHLTSPDAVRVRSPAPIRAPSPTRFPSPTPEDGAESETESIDLEELCSGELTGVEELDAIFARDMPAYETVCVYFSRIGRLSELARKCETSGGVCVGGAVLPSACALIMAAVAVLLEPAPAKRSLTGDRDRADRLTLAQYFLTKLYEYVTDVPYKDLHKFGIHPETRRVAPRLRLIDHLVFDYSNGEKKIDDAQVWVKDHREGRLERTAGDECWVSFKNAPAVAVRKECVWRTLVPRDHFDITHLM